MKKILYIIFLFCLSTQMSFSQATTSQVCTGEIRTNITAAQACANITQTQGALQGYNTTCTVNKVSLVAGVDPLSGLDYYYDTTCTVNGSTGHSAYLLSGFQATSTSNALVQTVPSGWNILRTELQYESAYRQCNGSPYLVGGSWTCTPPNSGARPANPVTGTRAGTNATSTNPLLVTATGVANIVQQNLLSLGRELAGGAVDRFRTAVGLTDSVVGISQTLSSSTTGSICAVPTKNLAKGDSGDDVLKLTQVLVAEGFMRSTQSTFDQVVFDAVLAYQEKNAKDILTPLGLTKGTGFVGDSTRAFMQKRCQEKSASAIVGTNPFPSVFYPESNTSCSVVRPFPVAATRIKIGSQVNKGWVGLGEVEIYDMQGNIIKPTEVYADSQYGTDIPWNAFDGNKRVGWNSGPTTQCTAEYCWHSATLYIVLGGVKQISKVKFYNKSTPAPAEAKHWIMYSGSDRFGAEVQASVISGNLQGDTWYESCSK